MNYVPRELAATVRRALRTFPAVLVTGARQAGKTTLLREEFGEGATYVSLDRPDVRARALADPVAFLDSVVLPAILDEIQQAPDLLPYIKGRIDSDRTPGRWLLTGSQSFPLMKGVSESLAGRVAVLSLHPLSTCEAFGEGRFASFRDRLEQVFRPGAGSAQEPHADLPDWLLRGGFPEIRTHSEVDRQLWFASYVQTYLERDIRDLAQVANLETFRSFLFLLGSRTGQILNLAELGREAGISAPTARSWLSVLESTQLVYLLKPYHRNYGKRIRKSPKLFLLDPGLATFLLGLHTKEALLGGPSLGPLVETAVVSEWVAAARHAGENPGFYYWQSNAAAEVDLIIEYDGRLHGLEVKATATPRPRHAEGLAKWLALAGPRARGAMACRVQDPVPLRPGIRAVPWHLTC